MSALSYFTIEEFRNVAGLRNIVGYENMSWQELENICATPSATIPTTIEVPRPRIRPRPKLPNGGDELKKTEMEKSGQYQKMLSISIVTV